MASVTKMRLLAFIAVWFLVAGVGARSIDSSEESLSEESEESAESEETTLADPIIRARRSISRREVDSSEEEISAESEESEESAESEESGESALSGSILRARRSVLDEPEYVYAKAQILPNNGLPRDDRKTRGMVYMRQRKSSQGVYRETEFKVQLEGLQSSSLHGFHVHEFGTIGASCSGAGGHYNPFDHDHGSPAATARHIGDLGNVSSDADGKVTTQFSDVKAKLYSLTTIVGRAFVVHQGMDDLGVLQDRGSKTTGNAGARLACGVIIWSDGLEWRPDQP